MHAPSGKPTTAIRPSGGNKHGEVVQIYRCAHRPDLPDIASIIHHHQDQQPQQHDPPTHSKEHKNARLTTTNKPHPLTQTPSPPPPSQLFPLRRPTQHPKTHRIKASSSPKPHQQLPKLTPPTCSVLNNSHPQPHSFFNTPPPPPPPTAAAIPPPPSSNTPLPRSCALASASAPYCHCERGEFVSFRLADLELRGLGGGGAAC
jgi:hypothetical protein